MLFSGGDHRASSPADKDGEVSNDSRDLLLCRDSEGIIIYIDLPVSPGEETAHYQAHEEPLESWIGVSLEGCRICSHTSSPSVRGECAHGKRNGNLTDDVFSGRTHARSRSDDDLENFSDQVTRDELLDSGCLGRLSPLQEMLETVPSLEMPSPSVKDVMVERILGRPDKERLPRTLLARDSNDRVKGPSQVEFSATIENSETKISSNLGPHALRSLLEVDNVQRFKRRRLTTSADPNAGGVSEVQEMCESLDLPKPSMKDGLAGQVVVAREEGLAGIEFPRRKSYEQLITPRQIEVASTRTDKSETKIPSLLGSHALRAILEAGNVQRFKRRRLIVPVDVSLVRDLKQPSITNSAVLGTRELNGTSGPTKGDCFVEPFVRSTSHGKLMEIRMLPGSEHARDAEARDAAGSGDYNSEKCPGEVIKSKSDVNSDSSSAGRSSSQSLGRDSLDKYVSRPSDTHVPKRKEWLAQNHGDSPDPGIVQDAGFAGNVGCCYRSAIDKRPAAPHPGFVGDGATVQYCRVCGEREDATSSLICDSCEEVFHMSCVNSRMKIVPRVDEWLCRPCRRKRKMSREYENQGDSDLGAEPKDWWREDAGIGKIERELLRMSNGRRMKVRMGPKYQAEVPDWTGIVVEVDLDDTLAETANRFGEEISLTSEEKQQEQERAVYNLENKILPKGWLPAFRLPWGSKENWIQCKLVLFDEGEICPDGRKADKDIICGKWRRAPLNVVPNDHWECSCALVWDPRHADCAVPQELSTEEIYERRKFPTISLQQELAF